MIRSHSLFELLCATQEDHRYQLVDYLQFYIHKHEAQR